MTTSETANATGANCGVREMQSKRPDCGNGYTALDAALAYARRGWRVLPIRPNKKAPACSHGVKDATTDEAQIREWFKRKPTLGVGIACGKDSNLIVLDIDPRNGGDESWREFVEMYGNPPETVTALTAGGGEHWLFRYDAAIRSGILDDGIDVLAEGKYFVAHPTTIHGRRYEWETSSDPFDDVKISPLPGGWRDAILAPKGSERPPETPNEGIIPEGKRDEMLTSLAGTMRRRGMTENAILAALKVENRARCNPPLPGSQVCKIAASVGKYVSAEVLGAEPRVLPRVPLDDIEHAELPPPRFVTAGALPRGATTLLGGHGGVGKSILAESIAATVAAGVAFAGLPTVQGRALFVSLEDPGELVRYRLQRIIQSYQLAADAVRENLMILDGSNLDGTLAREVVEQGAKRLRFTPLWDHLEAAAAGFDLVVIDNASDAFSANENDRQLVRTFIRRIGQLARANDTAVLLLAHIDKHAAKNGAPGNTYSGSTAWNNSVRSRLALIQASGGIELVQEKFNLGRPIDPILFKFDERGVLVPGFSPDVRAAEAIVAKSDDETVLTLIRRASDAGESVPTGQSGPKTTVWFLSSYPDWPAWFNTSDGKRRFRDAIRRLEMTGRIVRQSYRNNARNERQRFLCVD